MKKQNRRYSQCVTYGSKDLNFSKVQQTYKECVSKFNHYQAHSDKQWKDSSYFTRQRSKLFIQKQEDRHYVTFRRKVFQKALETRAARILLSYGLWNGRKFPVKTSFSIILFFFFDCLLSSAWMPQADAPS